MLGSIFYSSTTTSTVTLLIRSIYVVAIVGVPCVIFAITELCDSSALPILNHFYHALLGVVELDIASDTAPLDSIEALQAAVFRLMFTGDNYANPRRWSGLVFSGIPVDMRGRTR